jgi:hypothetical protein
MAACRLCLGAIRVRVDQEHSRIDGDTQRTPSGCAADRLVRLPVGLMAANLGGGTIGHRHKNVSIYCGARSVTGTRDMQQARGCERQHQQQDKPPAEARNTKPPVSSAPRGLLHGNPFSAEMVFTIAAEGDGRH